MNIELSATKLISEKPNTISKNNEVSYMPTSEIIAMVGDLDLKEGN